MPTNYNKRDDLRKIKEFVRKREVDEGQEIPSKAKDRVHTSMARSIRQVNPLQAGSCQLCMNYTEKLMPVNLRICKRCLEKFITKVGSQRVLRIQPGTYYCDTCGERVFKTATINPDVCYKCMQRIGKHQREREVRSQKREAEKYRQRIQRIKEEERGRN